mgnify:CR=1 FL=1
MKSDHTRSILGWFMRVKFLPAPTTTDEKKFYTMVFKNVDSGKAITSYYPLSEGINNVIKKYDVGLEAGKKRFAGILVGGAGLIRKFASTNTKTGVNAKHHPSDVLLGQWAQSKGLYNQYMTSEKAAGIYGHKEWDSEQKKVMIYKASYKKKMIALSKSVLSERANLIKSKNSRSLKLDKAHYFTLSTAWSFYREDTRLHD